VRESTRLKEKKKEDKLLSNLYTKMSFLLLEMNLDVIFTHHIFDIIIDKITLIESHSYERI